MTLVQPANSSDTVLAKLAGAVGKPVLVVEDGAHLEGLLQLLNSELLVRAKEDAEPLPDTRAHGTPPLSASDGQPGALATVQGANPTQHPAPFDYQAAVQTYAFHDNARRHAELLYGEAVQRYVAAAEHEALKAKRSKKAEDDLLTLWLLLMEEAEETGYQATTVALSSPGARTPGGIHWQANAQQFAQSRQPLLREFGRRTWKNLAAVADTAAATQANRREVAALVRRAGNEVRNGEGQRLVQTEAQATYGSAQMRLLSGAGFKTAIWKTMEDERVRETHRLNGEHPPVPLGGKWPNGQAYPGDPAGGAQECINCRCWLVGGSR